MQHHIRNSVYALREERFSEHLPHLVPCIVYLHRPVGIIRQPEALLVMAFEVLVVAYLAFAASRSALKVPRKILLIPGEIVEIEFLALQIVFDSLVGIELLAVYELP